MATGFVTRPSPSIAGHPAVPISSFSFMNTRVSRFATVLNLCSFLVLIYSVTMLVPVFVGLIYHEHDLSAFIETFIATFLVGAVGLLLTHRADKNLRTRDGFIVVVLFWVIFSVVSAMPLALDGRLHLSIIDALFEAISGITTTGASVLQHIGSVPKSVLYYRAQLNYLGGLGIIVLAIAILPLLGVGGAKIYQSETPGPMKEEKLTPRLTDTAKHLWGIYLGLALACTLSFHWAGMDWFDSVCHSLSTMALGGFSTHGASIGYYHSNAIELVAGIFSTVAGVNFALYYLAVNRRSVIPIITDPEFLFYIFVAFCVTVCVSGGLYLTHTFGVEESVVHGFFQTMSVMADNGLMSAHFNTWPEWIVMLLLGMSFFGGCVGSTCGGIKVMRFLLLYRHSTREIRQLIHPSAVYTIKVGHRAVSDRVISSVWGLFFLFASSSALFILGLMIAGNDFRTSFGTVAACINNMGIGYGTTALGFGGLNTASKWLMCAAMLFGRLEIFPILIVSSRTFWSY